MSCRNHILESLADHRVLLLFRVIFSNYDLASLFCFLLVGALFIENHQEILRNWEHIFELLLDNLPINQVTIRKIKHHLIKYLTKVKYLKKCCCKDVITKKYYFWGKIILLVEGLLWLYSPLLDYVVWEVIFMSNLSRCLSHKGLTMEKLSDCLEA